MVFQKVGNLAVSLAASTVDRMVSLKVVCSVDTMVEWTDMTSAGKSVELKANVWDDS